MGNCVGLQVNTVKVVKQDGEILTFKSPLKVHQVLSQFSHHAISSSLPAGKHLHPDAEMIHGKSYYLVPLTVSCPTTKKKKKKVSFSDDTFKEGAGAVRVKFVIRKQELQAMLELEQGRAPAEHMIQQTLPLGYN